MRHHRPWIAAMWLVGAAVVAAPALVDGVVKDAAAVGPSPGGRAEPGDAPLPAETRPPAAAPGPEHPADGGHHGAPTPPQAGEAADGSAVVEAYREANMRMHEAMSAPGTGDADRDFAAAMIAHHQGAIDMAHILLRYGRDPELRALAEDVIEVQQREIEFLRRWLAERPRE